MKKRVLHLFLCATLFAASSLAQTESFIGLWLFSAPALPAGYDTGLITFNQDGDTLTGAFIVGGKNLKAKSVTIDGSKAVMAFEVSGNPLLFNLERTDEGLKGGTTFQETPIDISCKRFDLGDCITGAWNIQVFEAPAGYEKGTFTFTKDDKGEVMVNISIANANTKGFGFKSDLTKFSFAISEQGINIPIAMEWRDSYMIGEAEADGQKFKITAYKALD